ncbi:VWA domain-containing protein [bacterium]|nr:VWA domain-containing protein [bacterium]
MISLLNPFLLFLALPITGLLIWAYRKKGDGKRFQFGSLFLLQQIQERSVIRRRFSPPPRFFVELLFLLLTVAALSGVMLRQEESVIVLLFDNSESMGVRRTSGESRLEEGRVLLTEWIADREQRGGAPRYRVFSLAPQPRELSDLPLSASAARTVLSKLSPVAAEEQIEAGLQIAARTLGGEEVVLVSDRAAGEVVFSEGRRFHHLYVGSDTKSDSALPKNIALAGAEYLSSSEAIEVRLYVSETTTPKFSEQEAIVTLSEVSEKDGSIVLKDFRRNRFTFEQSGEHRFRFKNIRDAQSLHIRVQYSHDLLAADNEMWLSIRPHRQRIVLSAESSAEELGLLLGGGKEIRRSPLVLPLPPGEDGSVYISERRVVPLEREEIPPGIHVLPLRKGDTVEEILPVQAAGKLVRAQRGHPVLDYVDLQVTDFGQVSPLIVPEWGEPLLETEAGVIAYIGVPAEKPVVITGFQLFPLRGEATPFSTIFFLNAMKWITTYLPDERKEWRPGGPLPERFSARQALSFATSSDQALQQVGERLPLERSVLVSPARDDVEGEIHFFSPQESSLSPPPLGGQRFSEGSAASPEQERPLLPYLLLLILVLLAGDLVASSLSLRYRGEAA